MIPWEEQLSWFAVQTKPFKESLSEASIAQLDVETFLPRMRAPQWVAGIERVVVKPLFPCYLLARFEPAGLLDRIKLTRGVLRILGAHQTPSPVPEEIVDCLRERVAEDGYVHLQAPRLKPGDQVTVKQGPFQGFMGRVERESDDQKRVSIFLEALNQARVMIEKQKLDLEFGFCPVR